MKRPRDQRAVRSGRWKLVQDRNDFYLFDLSDDPGERHDLTSFHPEVVRKLNAALDQWERNLASHNRATTADQH
jgi:arylsulfatase A-like enzyme